MMFERVSLSFTCKNTRQPAASAAPALVAVARAAAAAVAAAAAAAKYKNIQESTRQKLLKNLLFYRQISKIIKTTCVLLVNL